MAYVYRHIRNDKNEPFYIGIGSDKNYKRANTKEYRNKIWLAIVNKTPYDVEILIDDIPYNRAKEKEIEFIKMYGRIITNDGPLANMTGGGDGLLGFKARLGKGHTYESRLKISNGHKGKKLSSESKIKMSQSRTGVKNKLFGEQKKIRFSCISPEGELMQFDSILDSLPVIKGSRGRIAHRVNGLIKKPINGYHSFKIIPKSIMERLPKKFFKMTAEQQEVFLVEYLAKLHDQEDYYKRELAKVRGGYQYEVSTEIDRPDLLTMKQGEGV